MPEHDLQELGNLLAKSILDNKNVEALVFSVARVISYLESEQAKRKELGVQMDEIKTTIRAHGEQLKLSEKSNWEAEQMKKQMEKNGKTLNKVLAAILCYGAIELVKLAFGHK